MTIGIILAIIYLLLVSRIAIRRTKNIRLKQVSLTLHKVLGVTLPVVTAVHLLLVWKLIRQRPMAMYVTGIVMLVLAVAEGLSFLYRSRMKKNWMWVHRAAVVGIFLCLSVHMIFGFVSLGQYKEAIRAIQLDEIQIGTIADGDYVGEYDAGYVYARVSVKVADGQIQSVDLLEHRTERGQSAEVIPEQIVEQQKIAVDAVSGATNSSLVIEKAVCNAVMGDARK